MTTDFSVVVLSILSFLLQTKKDAIATTHAFRAKRKNLEIE